MSAIIYISWKDINNNLKKENLQRLIVVRFKNVLDTHFNNFIKYDIKTENKNRMTVKTRRRIALFFSKLFFEPWH